MKKKQFDKDTLREALELLQPVTPTDSEHRSDWWQTDAALIILSSTNTAIYQLRLLCEHIETKQQLSQAVSVVFPVRWPLKPEVGLGMDFWNSKFGQRIQEEWKLRMDNFLYYVNKVLF